MVVAAMNGPGDKPRTSAATFTIRFPQVDAAGIVFYPRYFEMIARCFPWLPLDAPPYVVDTQFLKPNRLGDQLNLEVEAAANSRCWSVDGMMMGETHFTMRSMPIDDLGEAGMPRYSFETASVPVGDCSVGKDGKLLLSRSFELVNVAIEEWFEDSLGLPFHELHVGRKTGIPTARFSTSVRCLPTAGSTVTVGIRPTKIGNRSMQFTSWIASDDDWLIRNDQVVVFVRMLDGDYETDADSRRNSSAVYLPAGRE